MGVKGLTQQFGDKGMKMMLETVFPRLPKTAVGVGDSWSSKSAFPMPGTGRSMTFDATLALESVEGDTATLLVDGTVKMGGLEPTAPKEGKDGDEANPMNEMLKSMKFEVKNSTISGTQTFDLAKGCLADATVTSKFDASMEMKMPGMEDNGEGAPGFKLSMKMNIKATAKLLSHAAGAAGAGEGF